MRPERSILEGRTVRLEPIGLQHASDLYRACVDQAERFRYLSDPAPANLAELQSWIQGRQNLGDGICHAVVERETGRAEGRQSLVRIDHQNRVAEIGGIYWGPRIARRTPATEAFFLAARHVFDDLGFRRLEWKMNALNTPGRRAADRFGFSYEGTFRKHMIQKGRNRDTAWFSIIDDEWPAVRERVEEWLDPANFTADGVQIRPLRRR